MTSISRRTFLGNAALAGVGTTVFGPLSAASGQEEAGTGGPISDIDPGFVAGNVVAIGPAGEITVRDPDAALRVLRIDNLSHIWKEAQWNVESLSIGDCIYARGELGSDGILSVERLWANIGSLAGSVKTVTPDELVLTLDSGEEHSTRVIDLTEVQAPSGAFVVGDVSGLGVGTDVQLIEFVDPQSGASTSSRVLLLSGVDGVSVAASDEDRKLLDRVGLESERGLTSWFCCGNVGGCGSGCGASGGGQCGGCRSDRNHMAWPKTKNGTSKCGPFIGNCDFSSVMARLKCDSDVSLLNPCHNKSVNVKVKDCGPTMRCVSPTGCKDRQKVKFDLTPCAFSAIGDLAAGLNTVNATYLVTSTA